MKASKEDYNGGMQYMANMHEPTMDRAEIGQNNDQNMLTWRLKDLGMQAYKLCHNKATMHNTQRHLKHERSGNITML